MKEVDEDNEKKTMESGWVELMTWVLKAADILHIPRGHVRESLFDIGSGQGYVLRYAAMPGTEASFDTVVGIERNNDLEKLTKWLPKNVSVISGDASDRKVMKPLVSKATVIFWNGLKFNSTAQTAVITNVSNDALVGTFVLSNVAIIRSNFMLLKQSVSFDALDPMVAWSHQCEWFLYILLPRKVKKQFKQDTAALVWIFEAFRVYAELKNNKKFPYTCATIRDMVKAPLRKQLKCEICSYYWGKRSKKSEQIVPKQRRRTVDQMLASTVKV